MHLIMQYSCYGKRVHKKMQCINDVRLTIDLECMSSNLTISEGNNILSCDILYASHRRQLADAFYRKRRKKVRDRDCFTSYQWQQSGANGSGVSLETAG